MGDIADWHVEKMTGTHSAPRQTVSIPLDVRSILHRFQDEAIKQTAREMYNEGLRASSDYESMTVDIMNRPGPLSPKQKNALITFIMYAN